MESEPGRYDTMEKRFATGSFRRKSNVPRPCCPRPLSCEFVDFSSDRCEKPIQTANEFFDIPPDHSFSTYTSQRDEELDSKWDQLLGQKVCISGVKEGILRYYGRTKFADGLWCGVELEEPVGKNNGTVNGVRYFYCEPNHGIFAPVTKVCLMTSAGPEWESEYRCSTPDRSFLNGNLKHTPQATFQDCSFLKQSASDPSFLKQSTEGTSGSFGDKRSLTEQRELSALNNHGNDLCALGVAAVSGKPKDALPFIANDTMTIPTKAYSIAEYNKHIFGYEHSIYKENVFQMNAEKQHRFGNPIFPRKVMSEYALCSEPNKTAITQSISCPQTSTFASQVLDVDTSNSLTPTNPEIAFSRYESDATHAKHTLNEYPEICSNPLLSSEFLNLQEDFDDDQMSLDFDESLGILTPNQMKDFTICADPPTSCTDIRAVDFPSSESFDDINDIPEDEQLQNLSLQYIASDASTVVQSLALARSDIGNSVSHKGLLQEVKQNLSEKHVISSTGKFLFSISSNNFVNVDFDSNCPISPRSIQAMEAQNSMSQLEKQMHKSKVVKRHSNCEPESFSFSEANEQMELPTVSSLNDLSSDTTIVTQERCVLFTQSNESLEDSKRDNVQMNVSQQLSESEIRKNIKISGKRLTVKHFEEEVKPRKNYDSDSSRDSLLQAEHESMISKEKLTVSWEDCIAHDSQEMFNKVERPESVYTVGSNDTGYQEDGEFDGDVGMTTSMESSEEGKRFSTTSRDSCVIVEDMDGDKVAESTSTSGYSTGLSDSCCNDRPDEETCKPLAEDLFQDMGESCNSDDANAFPQDSGETHLNPGRPTDFYDADSYKDSESTLEYPVITESNTLLCLDSTSETLCDTLIEDVMTPEKEESKIAAMCNNDSKKGIETVESAGDDKEINFDNEDFKSLSTGGKNSRPYSLSSSQKSGSSSCKSTPEKKPDTTKSKFFKSDMPKNKKTDTHKDNALKKSKDNSESADKKKQITKSPKKNVMSKIKAMIEATSCKTINKPKYEHSDKNKVVAIPKKSRWEAVTSKIAASLAEEKTKPKVKKDVRSKVDTNLLVSRQVTCRSPKLDPFKGLENRERCLSPSSMSSKSRRTSLERKGATTTNHGSEHQMHVTEVQHRPRSPRPGQTCLSSRSASPVAASESSASVSLNSHNSRSKIAVWKGSTSTVASSVPPVQAKKQTANAIIKIAPPSNRMPPKMVPKRGGQVGRLKPSSAAISHSSVRSISPCAAPKVEASLAKKSQLKPKNTKEQSGNARPLHPVAPRPVRPPMWLSKAELTQEIQHLGTLCEARTKELNRLKMETKHVTVGFDAMGALIKYLAEDLNAFANPQLAADFKEAQKKLDQGKIELDFYKKETDELKILHATELADLSEKLSQIYQNETHELSMKHNAELNYLKEYHQEQVEGLTAAYNASSEETKLQHEKVVDELKQELRKQREEMEIFHQHELDDMEARLKENKKMLQAQFESLQKQYAEMQHQSQTMEDALQQDTDSKLQWITSKKVDLEKEVDSLKAVLEIKNNELHALRKENLEMQKEIEEIPLARERIKMLQARAEDLQAVVAEKVRFERQLSTEHQVMKETYERESKVNKRLSMENEELQWRLRQTAEYSSLSVSLTDECETSTSEVVEIPSPVKSPRPVSASRPVFFTYMNQEEVNAQSPQSPRTHYKRIQPASYKSTSPSKSFSSPATTSPRKSKSSNETSPRCGGSTPRKMAKHLNRTSREIPHRRQRLGSDEGRSQNNDNNITCADSSLVIYSESMVSSASSENSVFEQGLLEEHGDQILASLELLRKERNSEFVMDVSSCPLSDPDSKWSVSTEMVNNRVPDLESNNSAHGETIDPKTYYHMTFPVLKESGQDGDTEENGKENFGENSDMCLQTEMENEAVSGLRVNRK